MTLLADEPRTAAEHGVQPLLAARGVRKIYRTGAESVDALKGIDLVVAPGEFVSVMGQSGSGCSPSAIAIAAGRVSGCRS